jgi:ABC-type multidrug transport system permease subunit
MNQVLASLGGGFRAEAQQLSRSRLLVGLTIVQAVTFMVMVSIFGLTGSHVPPAVSDEDGGRLAHRWVAHMAAAHHTYGVRYMSAKQARRALHRGDVAAVITIPRGFSDRIAHHQMIRVPFNVDNVNADLTDDVERGIPSVAVAFARENSLPGIRVAPAERDLVDREADFIPYLVVSALALDTFVVAGVLAATAVAREFEARTVTGLRLSPTNPLIPLAGRVLASSVVSAVAIALTALVVVFGYRVVPIHASELVAALLLCVVIFSCVGAGIGALLKRTLPVTALVFGLALPLYIDSGSLEPARFDGDLIWAIGHTSPVYYAVGVLQHAVHDLRVTPEPIAVNFAALIGWALLAGCVAWLAMRRGVRE